MVPLFLQTCDLVVQELVFGLHLHPRLLVELPSLLALLDDGLQFLLQEVYMCHHLPIIQFQLLEFIDMDLYIHKQYIPSLTHTRCPSTLPTRTGGPSPTPSPSSQTPAPVSSPSSSSSSNHSCSSRSECAVGSSGFLVLFSAGFLSQTPYGFLLSSPGGPSPDVGSS